MDKEEYFSAVEKDSAINNLLDAFVKARELVGFPTNKKGFDEDVNIYIAHLLFAIAMPNYNYITEQYISMEEKDVRMLIDLAEDNYLRYFIYKVNGDNLLLHLGLFGNLKPLLSAQKDSFGRCTEEDYLKLAQQYYQEAANCNRKIHRKKTALSEVLTKMVKNFKYYAKALTAMKQEYYFFYDFYEDEEFCKFSQKMDEYERKLSFKEKQDKFLDLYARWLRHKSQKLKKQINDVCKELHTLEPSFSFRLD